MNKHTRMTVSVLIVSLAAVPALQAQLGQPRPAPDRARVNPFGIGQSGFGRPMLQPRALQDHPLDEKEQKKYDAAISALERRSGTTARGGASAGRVTELTAAFRLGSTHLRFGQEEAAKTAFEKAWQMVPELYGDTRSMAAATGQVRAHLRDLQTGKEPDLTLTLMSELNDAHQKAFDTIEQPRGKEQLAQPLAEMWFQLMQVGQLDKDSMARGATWVMRFPRMAMADRPLPPEQAADYDAQVTQVSILAPQRLRQLAERQMGRPGLARPLNPGQDTPETVDPVTAQIIAVLDAKRGPITGFMEADVHFRFGQFRLGMTTTANAWGALLEYYRANPGSAGPVDADVHFESLAQIAGSNPVQAAVLLDQIDPLYRNMLQVDRLFGVKVADHWASLADTMPLAPPMLVKAAFWLEHVSNQYKNLESKYANALEEIKQQIEAAGAPEDPRGPRARRAEPQAEGEAQDRNTQRRGIAIPRSPDRQIGNN